MALSPIEMIEYLQRLHMSEPHPNPAIACVLARLHHMLEDNVPLSLMADILTDGFLQEEEEEERGNNNDNGGSGLSTEKISKHLQVSVRHDKMDGECIICLREYEKNERIGTLDNCRHEFHADCVKDWLLRKNECPLCRATGLKDLDNIDI
ncbi:zinc finger, RING/FYVE/PHD-type [Artemisia annua]|uniref:RING-type E3 ubiquitin transferase n=1 Tax=Artemisia annua TaxID=35608 RepID=A0A2U1NY04_ARTAN|nr:zinc finger, RING/FYVE/PHD-type [Artemisia annua]